MVEDYFWRDAAPLPVVNALHSTFDVVTKRLRHCCSAAKGFDELFRVFCVHKHILNDAFSFGKQCV